MSRATVWKNSHAGVSSYTGTASTPWSRTCRHELSWPSILNPGILKQLMTFAQPTSSCSLAFLELKSGLFVLATNRSIILDHASETFDMTSGTVSVSLEASVPLLVHGTAAPDQLLDVIIDTGFDGELVLPPATIATLQLKWLQRVLGKLADGSLRGFDLYQALVTWEGQQRTIEVEASDVGALMGMEFLRGHKLEILVTPGGTVTVNPVP